MHTSARARALSLSYAYLFGVTGKLVEVCESDRHEGFIAQPRQQPMPRAAGWEEGYLGECVSV